MSADATTPSLPQLQSISAVEFARRLNDLKTERDKRYAFFLGSGCSVSSGIKTAGGLVADEWLPKLHRLRAPEERDRAAWATREFGYDPANPAASYGKLMDLLFLNSEERQREIERLCDGTFPAFGYSVLAELMAQTQEKGTFNVVLTTNFDDLIADALYLFTSVRPLVIHHEALAGYIRPTRTRPLIIKLHGDNHLTPYNTPDETAALLPKTNKQVSNLLHDRGLILLGYSGNDESVSKMLEALPDEALPLSIYWVSKEAPKPTPRLEAWLHKRKAIWVESSDFDAFMILIHAELSLGHPAPDRFQKVFDQRMETYERLTALIQDSPANTPEKEALKTAVEKVDQSFDGWTLVLEANRLKKTDPQAAEVLYVRALEAEPKRANILANYALFLYQQQRPQEAEAFFLRALEAEPKRIYTLKNYAQHLFINGRPTEGLAQLDQAQALITDKSPFDLQIQVAFYELAHRPPLGSPAALAAVKKLLLAGARSKGWNLSGNVAQAQQGGHPYAEWLPKLAAVITEGQSLDTLADWPEWQQASE